MNLRGRIEAFRRHPDRERDSEYAELRAEAVGKLAGARLIRDLWPCEDTGLLVAQSELVVSLVDAAAEGRLDEARSLQRAVENIHQVLARPRPAQVESQRVGEMRRAASWN